MFCLTSTAQAASTPAPNAARAAPLCGESCVWPARWLPGPGDAGRGRARSQHATDHATNGAASSSPLTWTVPSWGEANSTAASAALQTAAR